MEKRSCLFAPAFVGEFMLKFTYSLLNSSKEMLTAKNARRLMLSDGSLDTAVMFQYKCLCGGKLIKICGGRFCGVEKEVTFLFVLLRLLLLSTK